MRSLSLLPALMPGGERRSPAPGPRHKGFLPRHGGAGSPGLRRRDSGAGFGACIRRAPKWEQAEGATQSNNYWSSTTYQNNPSNAWNVNFNDGNTNANNKTNSNYVRAVRAGS